ncbi:MAG TPA: glycosyltransferase family 2 protein [Acidiferrobacterales bacterium]
MPFAKQQLIVTLRTAVVAAYLGYAPYYLYWRLGTFNPEALIFSWAIWGAELFGYFTALLHVFMVARLTAPAPPPAPEGLKVDVFVTTYNEGVELLRHTLFAAVNIDYPHATWLLDDGNNPAMAALAAELGCRYLARADNRDAKAGNLNNALEHSNADFIAVFDADHVPSRNFLTRTLGFFRDERVAFVQTPQDYYNLDSYQHRRHRTLSYIWTEQSLFFRVIQRGKDRWNAAFFCGSCAVLRTRALREIGGFATGSVTEDLHTSLRLHKRGWKSVYLNESLAYGLAPGSVNAYLSQRRRWGQGAVQVWRKEGIVFARGLTAAQRLNYLASVLAYFDGWPKAIFYLAPIVVLTTGVMPIHVPGAEFLAHFIPFYLLCFWAYEEAGRGYGRTLLTEQYNMARFAVFLRATVEGFTRRLRFSVTPKQGDGGRERRHIVPQLAVLAGSVAAIGIGTVLWRTTQHLETAAYVANVIWAGINLGLAGAVVRFTLRRRHRRRDYRFPIPLPVEIRSPEGEIVFALADDISIRGCKLITESPLAGERVQGRLFLPAGDMPFEARILHRLPAIVPAVTAPGDAARPARTKLHYGLVFEPGSERDTALLETFLYGSDLQWRILDLHEEIRTPVSRVIGWLSGDRQRRLRISPREWLPVVYRAGPPAKDGRGRLGVLSRGDWRRRPARLVVFDEIPVDSVLRIGVFGQDGADRIEARVVALDKLDALPSPVYLARAEVERQAVPEAGRRAGLAGSTPAVLAAAALAVAAGLGHVPAAQARAWLGLAGAEGGSDNAYYAYAGAIVPLRSVDALGRGWAQRYWVDRLGYDFESGGERIRAGAPGLSAALGYQGRAAGWQWAAYAGAVHRNTTLRPDKPDAAARGSQTAGLVIAEAGRHFDGGWQLGAIASATIDPDSYWTRLRVLRAVAGGGLAAGSELVWQGDTDYRQVKAGLVVESLRAGGGFALSVKLGVSKTHGLASGAYGGIEIARRFGGES